MADEPTKPVAPPVSDEAAAALREDLIAQVSTVQPFMLAEAFRLLAEEHTTGQYTPRELVVSAVTRHPDGQLHLAAKIIILPTVHQWLTGEVEGDRQEATVLRDVHAEAITSTVPAQDLAAGYLPLSARDLAEIDQAKADGLIVDDPQEG